VAGHAAIFINGESVKRRESTAGPEVNIDTNKDGADGGWEERPS
jgi:hypothetical protein